MIYWLTPQITFNDKLKKAASSDIIGTFQIKPSITAQANSACDIVTDVIVGSKVSLPIDILFLSNEGGYITDYLGGVSIKRANYFAIFKTHANEVHNLHIPVYGSGETKMIWGYLVVPQNMGLADDYKKTDDLLIKIGINR